LLVITTKKLKDYKHIELETNNLIKVLQNGAKEAASNSDPQNTTNNKPYEIKKLIAGKRIARSTWQRTYTPDSRKRYNKTTNKLKSKLHEMRNESFKAYVSSLRRDDKTIWNPIKHKKNPTASQLPIRKNSTPPGTWAKSDKEKADLFAEHLSEVFSPHNNDPNQEVEQDLATPIHQHERLKSFTLNEIKNEITKLNHKKAPGIDHITAKMLKEYHRKDY